MKEDFEWGEGLNVILVSDIRGVYADMQLAKQEEELVEIVVETLELAARAAAGSRM